MPTRVLRRKSLKNKGNIKLRVILFSIFVAVSIGACVTTPFLLVKQPINKKTIDLDLSKQGIVLLTVKIVEKEFSGSPQLGNVYVVSVDGNGNAIANVPRYKVIPQSEYRSESKPTYKSRDYLVSMQLDAGKYAIASFHIGTSKGIVAGAYGLAPVHMYFEAQTNRIIYLGFIHAVHRKRVCGEPRMFNSGGSAAASVLPFGDIIAGEIASDVFGYKTGIFDIDIMNNFDRDITVLRAIYPVLKNVSVESAVITPRMKLTPERIAAQCEVEKEQLRKQKEERDAPATP